MHPLTRLKVELFKSVKSQAKELITDLGSVERAQLTAKKNFLRADKLDNPIQRKVETLFWNMVYGELEIERRKTESPEYGKQLERSVELAIGYAQSRIDELKRFKEFITKKGSVKSESVSIRR